ncbi:MAG: hypothetical protein ACKOW9_04390 [Candidatus Paceibacterota bacterium]
MTDKQPSKKSIKKAEKRAKNLAAKLTSDNINKTQQSRDNAQRKSSEFGNIPIYLLVFTAVTILISMFYSRKNENISAVIEAILITTSVAIIFVAIRLIKNKSKTNKIKISIFAVFVIVASTTGLITQTVIDDKPVLKYTKKYEIYKLSVELLNDMRILEQNQVFFTLPYAQVRGLSDRIELAIKQDRSIATKWNPATTDGLPLPGFYEVLALVNKTADLQVQSLTLLKQDLEQPDSARASEISKILLQVEETLLSQVGAASKLAETIKPVGIVLKGDEEK